MIHYKKNIPQPVKNIIKRIMQHGGQAYIVGGAVRDLLMGSKVKDWDIATSFTPDEIKEIFVDTKVIETGKRFGTVTLITDNMKIEITTFRKESNYSDFRHPENVAYVSDIETDLSRRDFTINAIAFNPYLSASIIDPFNGTKDIEKKIIKTVGNPDDRFTEDPLRMMRAIRFASQLDFSPDNATVEAIRRNCYLIEKVSIERIRDELSKTLLGPKVSKAIELLYRTGILKLIIPDMDFLFKRGYLCHVCTAVEKCRSDLILRLAALFYLIETAYQNLKNLRYDNKTVKRTAGIISNLKKFHPADENIEYILRKIIGELGKEDTFRLLEVCRSDAVALINCKNDKTAKVKLQLVNRAIKKTEEIIKRKDPVKLKDLAIDGNDLIKIGIGKNDKREIGRALNTAYEWVLRCPKVNKKEVLIRKLKTEFTPKDRADQTF